MPIPPEPSDDPSKGRSRSATPGRSLERIAESVAESLPLDWDEALEATPDLGGTLQGLRAIAEISAAYRAAAEDLRETMRDPATTSARTRPRVSVADETGPRRSDGQVAPGSGGDTRPTARSGSVPGAVAATNMPEIGGSLAPVDDPGEGERAAPLFVWGHLEVRSPLGEGTFGEIYRAFDPTLQREVALKLYKQGAEPASSDDPMVHRSGRGVHPGLDEARSMARLRHPNVLAVHGVDVREGRLGIWTDLLEGETLEDRLATAGNFSDTEAALVGIELCRALAAIHRAGLVHGDVKTTNVMRESGGAIVLLDFSSNRELRAVAGMAGSERASGTPLVSPPEVLLGELPGAAADLYALGVLLFRLVSRRYPVEARTFADLIENHQTGRRHRLRELRPDLSPAFVSAVEQAIEADPAARISSAAEFERLLQEVFRGARLGDESESSVDARERGEARRAELEGRLRTARAQSRGSLQAPLSKILGREREIAEIRRRLEEARLVTLVGTGGAGKTRLAVEVAHAQQPDRPDGVWWADLTPIRDGGRLPEVLARSIGIETHGVRDLEQALRERLQGTRLLILVDNCEHVLADVRQVFQKLLSTHDGLKILATSRERLGIDGEEVVYVHALVQPAESMPLDLLRRNPCVALFQRRARMVDPLFEVSAENAQDVAEICRRLDGLPLAIELAAARVQVMPAPEIRARLDDRFALLSGGPRVPGGGPLHHETLQALLDWDYALLTTDEQCLLRRMSLFVAGWTLEAAEFMAHPDCLSEEESASEPPEVAAQRRRADPVQGILGRLLDKSLVQRSVVSGGRAYRFGMLETVRAYARHRLVDAREEIRTLRRQREWYARMAVEADQGMSGPRAAEWRVRLQAEHDNINEVLRPERVENAEDARLALRVIIDFWRYYFLRGHWRPVLEVTRALLERAELETESSFYAETLSFCGGIENFLGDAEEAIAGLEEALRIQDRLGERQAAGYTRMRLANVHIRTGSPDRAKDLYTQSLAIFREIGDKLGQATVLNNLARVDYHAGDQAGVERNLQESLALQREVEHPWGIASVLSNLGGLMGGLNRLDEARAYTEEGIERLRALGDEAMVATSLQNLATILAQMGEDEEARARIHEAARIHARVGDRRNWAMSLIVVGNLEAGRDQLEAARDAFHHALLLTKDLNDYVVLAQVFDGLGDVARRASEFRRAARLFGAARGVRTLGGSTLMPAIQTALDGAYASTRSQVGAEVFAEEFEQGEQMDVALVIDWLLASA